MLKRVLYISFDGLTDPLGQSQVLSYLVGLAKRGHQIDILSCEKAEAFEQLGKTVKEKCKQASITWHKLPYTNSPPIVGSYLLYRKVLKKAIEICEAKSMGLIHCRSYMASLCGLTIKKSHKISFVFDMRGFWPDERLDGNIWRLSNPIHRLVYRFFKRKEIEFLEHSSHIISLTHNGKQDLLERFSFLQAKKVTVIPCCADLVAFDFNRFEANEPTKTLNLCYLGSIGSWYMLDEMLNFFVVLLRNKPNAVFNFISGIDPNYLKSEVAKKGIAADKIAINRVNFEQVPKALSKMDMAIFFIKPVHSKKASSPVKQAELMGMGIPIICNAGVGDTTHVMEKISTLGLVEHFKNADYQLVVDHLDELLAIDKTVWRAHALNFYNLEEGSNRYHEVYQNI